MNDWLLKSFIAKYDQEKKEHESFVSLVREAFKEYGWTGPHVHYEEDMMFPLECGIDFPKCAMCQLKKKLEIME